MKNLIKCTFYCLIFIALTIILRSNHAADNLVKAESIIPLAEANQPIYRFWSNSKQGHFYTIETWEKWQVIKNDVSWKYEGGAFNAIPASNCGSNQKVYRFWSDSKQKHFYTIQEWEKTNIIANDPSWRYEGIAYCTITEGAPNSRPLYRFWSNSKQGHFYTVEDWEKNNIIVSDHSWTYEGIAFYVYTSTTGMESNYGCSCSKTCTEVSSCEEAYFQLKQCGCSQRDTDDDGIPCENLCSI